LREIEVQEKGRMWSNTLCKHATLASYVIGRGSLGLGMPSQRLYVGYLPYKSRVARSYPQVLNMTKYAFSASLWAHDNASLGVARKKKRGSGSLGQG
jgi:hypothetical protein